MSRPAVPPRIWFSIFAVFAFLVGMAGFARGQAPSPEASASPAPVANAAGHDLSASDLQSFLDGFMSQALENRNLAGAVVTVVKDGQQLFGGGFGYADAEKKSPILADQTLFRPGSISKLFTAIAVLQLVEDGKLDLDRDINEYLDFKIPQTFPQAITLRNLLTHTAGFEEQNRDLLVSRPEDLQSLSDFLKAHTPARIFAPGSVPAYSNYGVALAGYIVERVSGIPFAKYVQYQILRPLKMDHSTFEQPLPEAMRSDMSNGYETASDPPGPFELIAESPAGGLSSTGSDMARFMQALLNEGNLDGAQVLSAESVQEMEKRVLVLHPQANAMGLVIMEYRRDGPRVIGHGGDTVYFHSELLLIPEANTGLFISFNTLGNKPSSPASELAEAFLQRYFPVSVNLQLAIAAAGGDGKAVAGSYQISRRAETNLLRIAALASQVTVNADADGIVTVSRSKNSRGELRRWREISPLVYQEIDGNRKLVFRSGPDGQIADMTYRLPIVLFQKVAFLESMPFVATTLGIALLIIGGTVVLFPIAVILRRRYGKKLFPHDPLSKLFYVVARIVCILQVALVVVLLLFLSKLDSETYLKLASSEDRWLDAIHWLGWIGLYGGVLFMLGATFYFWINRSGPMAHRIHMTLLLIATAVFLFYAQTYHVLDSSRQF
jgi:CubicO group peptidase (beta-lactamase class C family)